MGYGLRAKTRSGTRRIASRSTRLSSEHFVLLVKSGATEAHLRLDSTVVHGHIEKGPKCNYEHLRALLAIVRMERARFPGGVTFERIPGWRTRRPTGWRTRPKRS